MPNVQFSLLSEFLVSNPGPSMSRKARAIADQSITLRSVAERAQVHPSTVSRALDPARRHLIADAVVARVETVARELGYRRNPIAAGLRTRRSKLVGVLVPDIANPVFSPIISGLGEALATDGYSTIVADVGSDAKRQMQLIDELMARRVDGLVLATVRRNDPALRHCRDAKVPVVLVNRRDDGDRVPWVVSDDRRGIGLAVSHLCDLGHRRIGHLAGPRHLSTGARRREGFVEAIRARGLSPAVGDIAEAASYDREAGEATGNALLDAAPDLTAIVAANDLLALGLLRALKARGLSCPAHVSVTGHNDMPLVDMVEPPLTTVRIGPRAMGLEAGALLLALLRDEPGAEERRMLMQPELIVRASTAAPIRRAP
jgi:LacI family transcriptional regulator